MTKDKQISSIFDITGSDENALTRSFGVILRKDRTLLKKLISLVIGKNYKISKRLFNNTTFYFEKNHPKGRTDIELINEKILALDKIPNDFKLSLRERTILDCVKNNKIFIDKNAINKFFNSLSYPLIAIDFETFNPAIPLFDGTRPYESIPFQYSIHIVNKLDDKPKHLSFLAEGSEDPRVSLLKSLKKDIPNKGTLLAYNLTFEKQRLKELGESFPKYNNWIKFLLPRFKDLMSPFRSLYYYNPQQKGSYSLKAVLPALTGESYQDMELNNGMSANIAFLHITQGDLNGNLPSEKEIKKLRKELEKYCALDTKGMVNILLKLDSVK